MNLWENHKILIFAKTFPEFSFKYFETVCTGGIREEGKTPLRLYPISYRYLDGDKQFRKYDWISVDIAKSVNDNRPESYKIRADSIKVVGHVDTANNWEERRRYILNDNFIFSSLEELRAKQDENGSSLGVIKPKEISDFLIKTRKPEELSLMNEKKQLIQSQTDFFRVIKDLTIPDYQFYLKFKCHDQSCSGHQISIIDWEIFELYRKLRRDQDWQEKIRMKISEICNPQNDLFLIFGNLFNPVKRDVFCIAGFFYPRKEPFNQMSLFD